MTCSCSVSHLADASAQVLVARGHDVALVLAHPITQAVVSVRALVRARNALNAGVLWQHSNSKQTVAVRAALIGRLPD